jgi:hypothetical protein
LLWHGCCSPAGSKGKLRLQAAVRA